ncbi:MAG: DUF4912 domain-containing protein [Acidobacteriota bacterium]|nr:DUF4912 domain-containing protein [Acidobacteriota bacterium]
MPYFFPGSSALAVAPTPLPPPAIVSDKLAEAEADEPLPATYAANRIRLLAQSPRRLFLYWEFRQDPFETLRRAFRLQAERYRLVVKLIDLETGGETLHYASPNRSHWFDVLQGRSYRADVGFYAQGRAFIRLLSSAAARTPRATVSRSADSKPQFQVSAGEFARVLDDAGYVSDALEVSLEAADQATGNKATRHVAREFAGADPPIMSARELAEMRGLLASLALGASALELRSALSARVARWLGEVSAAVDSARLIEILRSALGIEMEQAAFGLQHLEAMRRAARFVVGASQVNMPLRPFHLWMPSMSGARIK